MRFGPQVSRVYLDVLDERMKAVKDALAGRLRRRAGAGRADRPMSRSSSTRTARICGAEPTLGLDVHPNLKLNKQRLQETANFLHDFLGRLECIAGSGQNCPAGLATGAGTGFTLVTDHIPEFTKRGMCARDPKRALDRRRQHAGAAQDAERR